MESQYPKPPRLYGNAMKMSIPTLSQQSDNDRSSGELRALDCNLTSLCDHIQMEGFNSGSFSDIVVQVMGSTYHLHRLILSRSSYFSSRFNCPADRKEHASLSIERCCRYTIDDDKYARNMLHGPWKEARAQVVTLNIDDDNVNAESIAMALAYLYGHHPKLHDSNAFRVLAAASFLDLQDLCAICTDFIISDLWTSNFLAYQVFAESQDYGIHGERVKNACWGYLCQSGNVELKEVLPKLSSQTLHALLTSDELWVRSEEERFKLAVNTLLAKGSFSRGEHPEGGGSSSEIGTGAPPDSSGVNSTNLIGNCLSEQLMESEVARVSLKNDDEGHRTAHNILVELADCVVDYYSGTSGPNSQRVQETSCSQSNKEPRYSCKMEPPSSESNSFSNLDGIRTSCAYAEIPSAIEASRMGGNVMAMEGPSEESTYTHLNDNNWLPRDKSRHCSSATASSNGFMLNEWGRCSSPSPSWGGRIVGRRQVKAYAKGNYGVHGEEYDAFINIFEGGSLLYCNMTLKELVDARKQLEELGFPCKAVNDGLWLQMLLSHRLQEIVADSCKNCCLTSMACACRHAYGFSQGATTSSYYMQERVQVRGTIDGLAGIGRGTTFEPDPAWPPTRFVFSRVPFGLGNRNCQQSFANDEPEARADISGDLSGDGLTALVGLSQGGSSAVPIHGQQTERGYESDLHSRLAGTSVALASSGGIPVHMVESQSHSVGLEWENDDGYSITLDMKTPLRHFPPFRFGVEFEDVHRLSEAQVMASREVFYAGSLWKVTIQAFNDEDPQGRRTLGLFLHRRKAEITENPRKVPLYIDSREKVTARYQLICPSKREVMVFGSFKQTGTLLPKAPKGWGWRSALLFDELGDLLQGGALRVSAVVQIV